MNNTKDIPSNKKWKHFSDGEGNTYKHARVDGYDYGDRALDGVMFDLTVEDSGELSIKVTESSKEYFSDYNEPKWYATILKGIENGNEAEVEVGGEIIDVVLKSFDEEVTKSQPTPLKINANNVTNSINAAIQAANNGKTNITSNPDILESLGVMDDKEDPELIEYTTKLENFKNEISDKLNEKETELTTLNKIVDRNVYWEVFYNVDLFKFIMKKFFDREYMTHPKIRLDNIKTYLEELIHKYSPYLTSISYKISSEEDIEAFEKEYMAKSLLSEYFPVERKQEKKHGYIDFKEKGANISNESKTKFSNLLQKIEDGVDLEKESETKSIKELSEYDKADLKGKIALKYADVYKRAIELDGEEDGLIKTYVEGLYNPETTTLDDKNLLLNLLIVSRMQDFGVMKWEFDAERVKVSNTETNLKHDWWTKILTEDIEEDMKMVKIVEKELNLAFYTTFISTLISKADCLKYGERNVKLKKILSDLDENSSRESLLLDNILKKTTDGSILFITPDMEKWIQTENIINDELGDKGQVKYKGVWQKRHVFVINVEQIRGLSKYSNEIIYVNKGNSYVLNPETPIAYFNVIDNPFLERPIIKWFASAEFDISMDKAARMRVDNNFLD